MEENRTPNPYMHWSFLPSAYLEQIGKGDTIDTLKARVRKELILFLAIQKELKEKRNVG